MMDGGTENFTPRDNFTPERALQLCTYALPRIAGLFFFMQEESS
jgi:hypothetical protein